MLGKERAICVLRALGPEGKRSASERSRRDGYGSHYADASDIEGNGECNATYKSEAGKQNSDCEERKEGADSTGADITDIDERIVKLGKSIAASCASRIGRDLATIFIYRKLIIEYGVHFCTS